MRKTLKKEYLSLAYQLRQEGMSYRAISSKIGVSKTQVHKWLCTFANERPIMHETMGKKNLRNFRPSESEPPSNPSEEEEIARLKSELAKANKELAYQKLRADFYDEMINVAEGKFNISIRKKAGAKQ
ncbi:helix-turn-helix domain-containing protein [Bacteroides sp. An19]|uniref:helix-turn-helix domain-containing protein n=1 Tax=Bacteroides sp. An19 TaxID=1965580 RepID=UPI001123637C|nr:helix-turn-helix domain-containing protein [Bacteroides sp. An19]